jgi:acyl-CoA reductase-like NAD-dependent aldehyde dehydrogenase
MQYKGVAGEGRPAGRPEERAKDIAMAMKPFYVAGDWRTGDGSLDVTSPFDESVVAQVGVPTDADVEEAVSKAADTFKESRHLPTHARAEGLMRISRGISERVDELAELVAREGGKPLKWSKVEVTRAVSTFRWAAEEVRRFGGEFLPLDTEESAGSRAGIVRRFAIGPVIGITPFNFPVNLVAHKVAPALAVGAPIVIKPAGATPLGALALAELFDQTDLPKGMMSVLPISSDRAEKLVKDPRFKKFSFTGSGIGWRLKGLDPHKHVTLELGGNAGVIVHSDADLDHAAQRVAFGGYYQAGQSCIAVQRAFIQSEVYEDFVTRLVKQVESLKVGDPLDPSTDVGPLIDKGALERVDEWVKEAVQEGAEVLTGGKREDPLYYPTVLANTSPEMKVRCQEVFGPVITVQPYQTFEEALDEVNESEYGLQAGVFTSSIERAMLAHRELEVGGVIVNDVSAFRADQMPYGGSKESGYGREGLRYAMNEMTEPRIMVLSHVPL